MDADRINFAVAARTRMHLIKEFSHGVMMMQSGFSPSTEEMQEEFQYLNLHPFNSAVVEKRLTEIYYSRFKAAGGEGIPPLLGGFNPLEICPSLYMTAAPSPKPKQPPPPQSRRLVFGVIAAVCAFLLIKVWLVP